MSHTIKVCYINEPGAFGSIVIDDVTSFSYDGTNYVIVAFDAGKKIIRYFPVHNVAYIERTVVEDEISQPNIPSGIVPPGIVYAAALQQSELRDTNPGKLRAI